ncbi:hypothetical protein ACEQPO_26560 [Bacillus sp. SL00103]
MKLMITEDRDQDRHLFKIEQPETTYYVDLFMMHIMKKIRIKFILITENYLIT